jgi:hypothetical protein
MHRRCPSRRPVGSQAAVEQGLAQTYGGAANAAMEQAMKNLRDGTSGTTPPTTFAPDIQSRIQKLEDLKASGLIDDAQYQAKNSNSWTSCDHGCHQLQCHCPLQLAKGTAACCIGAWRTSRPAWLPSHYREVEVSYNSVTWEWQHKQLAMKLLPFRGLFGGNTCYRITAFFESDGAFGSHVTVNGQADEKTQAAIAAAAESFQPGGSSSGRDHDGPPTRPAFLGWWASRSLL